MAARPQIGGLVGHVRPGEHDLRARGRRALLRRVAHRQRRPRHRPVAHDRRRHARRDRDLPVDRRGERSRPAQGALPHSEHDPRRRRHVLSRVGRCDGIPHHLRLRAGRLQPGRCGLRRTAPRRLDTREPGTGVGLGCRRRLRRVDHRRPAGTAASRLVRLRRPVPRDCHRVSRLCTPVVLLHQGTTPPGTGRRRDLDHPEPATPRRGLAQGPHL